MNQSSAIVFFVIIFAIIVSIDLYVFQGLKSALSAWNHAVGKKSVYWLYWIISLGFPLFTVVGFMVMQSPPKGASFPGLIMNLMITLLVTKLVFALVLVGEDVFRAGHWTLAKTGVLDQDSGPALPSRRKFIAQAGLIAAAVPFSSFIYGITKGKYHYKVHKKVLYFKDLPAAFEGFTIAQLSDIHSGSFDDTKAVQRGVEMVKAQNADLFVFTGDLVNNRAEEIVPYKELFKQISSPFGQFSILGNHDYGDYEQWPSEDAKRQNLETLFSHHADMGFDLLNNEHRVIEKEGEKLYLAGVENWGKGFRQSGDLNKALQGIPEEDFTVLLSHDPTHFDHQVKQHPNKVHLTLSGHTHGMQMGVEIPGFRWSPASFRYKHWADLHEEDDRKLYVNRGFGFIGFSGRVGIWPEITVLELRKAQA